jgi:hypothetical protein
MASFIKSAAVLIGVMLAVRSANRALGRVFGIDVGRYLRVSGAFQPKPFSWRKLDIVIIF